MVCNLATVITNLLSAIPVFGQDIVELIKFIEQKKFFLLILVQYFYFFYYARKSNSYL